MQKRQSGKSGLEAFALGKGFLTDASNVNTAFDNSDFRNKTPRFSPEARRANQTLVNVPGNNAQEKGRAAVNST